MTNNHNYQQTVHCLRYI